MIQVRCPGCAATFELDERRLGKGGLRVRCPKCSASFHVSPAGEVSTAAPGAAPAAAPSAAQPGSEVADLPAPRAARDAGVALPAPRAPGGAPPPRSPFGGGAVGRPPVSATAVTRPAMPMPVPVPVSDAEEPQEFDLPVVAPPAGRRDANLPAVAGGTKATGVADLPARVSPKAPAPPSPQAPQGGGPADLPAVVAPGKTPAAGAKGDRFADLPAPASPRPAAPAPARDAADLPAAVRAKGGGVDLPAPASPKGGRADLPARAAPRPASPPLAPTAPELPAVAPPRRAPLAPTAPAPAPEDLFGEEFGELSGLTTSPDSDADLPARAAPRTGGGADLPARANPRGGADLPAPVSRPTVPGTADLPALVASRNAAPPAVPADLPATARPTMTGAPDLPAVAAPRKPGTADLPAVARNVGPSFGELSFDEPGDPAFDLGDLPVVAPPAPGPSRATRVGAPSAARFDSLDDLPAVGAPRGANADLPTPVAAGLPVVASAPLPAVAAAPLPAVATAPLPAVATAPLPAVAQAGLPAVPGADLPTPVGPDLPAPFAPEPPPEPADQPTPSSGLPARKTLGRVTLEKRAVRATVGENANLPAPATGAALPTTATAPLPTPAHRGDLPAAFETQGLPAAFQPGGGGFGEIDLPIGAADRAPSHGGAASSSSSSSSSSGEFDFSLPPPSSTAGAGAAATRSGAARGAAGGTGFGEISLGGDDDVPSLDADLPPRMGAAGEVGEEFGQIPIGPAEHGAPPVHAPSVSSPEFVVPSPTPRAAETAHVAPAGGAQRAREADDGAPPKRRGLYISLGLVGALVIGGAALSLTPAGPFGANLIDEKINGPERHAAAARAIASARAALERDEYGAAVRALRALDAQLAQTPNEPALAAFNAFAHNLVVARFGTEPALAARARALFDQLAQLPAGTPHVAAARAARELAAGHPERVRRAPAGEPMGVELVAMALAEGADPNAAMEAARAAAERPRASVRARYLYARALLVAEDAGAARQQAEALLAAAPRHAGARLVVARVLAAGRDDDARARAVELAQQVEAMTADASPAERTRAAVLIGEVERARERFPAAQAAFERALRLDPRAPAALNGAGRVLYRQGNYTDALARFQAAQSADASDLDAKIGFAMAALGLNRPADARRVLEPQLTTHGSDARVHFWMARVHQAQNDQTAAVREFREAIRLDNTNLEAYTMLSALLSQMQRPEAAEQVLQEARAHVSDQATIHRALGEQRFNLGQLAGAAEELALAVAARPTDASSHLLYGRVLTAMRRFDDAARAYAEVARIDPQFPGLLRERGLLAEARGDAGSALAMFRAALVADPQNPELIVRVAASLVATEQYTDADTQLARFVVEHPENAEAHFVLGRARLGQGNLPDALRLLERSTELDATRAEFRAWAAQANLQRGNFQRARELATEAIARDPNSARAFAVRAEVNVRTGAIRVAHEDAGRALQLDPTMAQAYVTIGDAYDGSSQPADAIEAYSRAIRLRPNQGEWHLRLARVFADQGRAGQAIASYERATGLGDPLNPPPSWLPQAHRGLADLLRERDRGRARQEYRRFLEIAAPNEVGRAEARAALDELGGG